MLQSVLTAGTSMKEVVGGWWQLSELIGKLVQGIATILLTLQIEANDEIGFGLTELSKECRRKPECPQRH